uniref:Uncharacterized protein n=1 Tax=Arundo donax TaxID=35708 RepID=A0A0A9STZ3_ARUDO
MALLPTNYFQRHHFLTLSHNRSSFGTKPATREPKI